MTDQNFSHRNRQRIHIEMSLAWEIIKVGLSLQVVLAILKQKSSKFQRTHGWLAQVILSQAGEIVKRIIQITIETTSFSIFYYSTAAISGKVYIIGGTQNGNHEQQISEYSNDQWREYGSLSTGRYVHSSITHNSETMIIGAYSSSAWVLTNTLCISFKYDLRKVLWNALYGRCYEMPDEACERYTFQVMAYVFLNAP